MSIDLNKVNKIDTDLVLPSIDDNLIETQRNKWGKILNEQTFKLLNNNIKILKDSLTETINTINNENRINYNIEIIQIKDEEKNK